MESTPPSRYDLRRGRALPLPPRRAPSHRRSPSNGRETLQRNRRGPTLTLQRGERDDGHLAQWVHSGHWLDPDCPVQIELSGQTDAGIELLVSFPTSPSRGWVVPGSRDPSALLAAPEAARRRDHAHLRRLPGGRGHPDRAVAVTGASFGIETELRITSAAPAETSGFSQEHLPRRGRHDRPRRTARGRTASRTQRPPAREPARRRRGRRLVHPRLGSRADLHRPRRSRTPSARRASVPCRPSAWRAP